MTDCPRAEIRDQLPDWVHGSLSASAASAVAAHLASCPSCTAEVSLLRSVRSVLGTDPHLDLDRMAAAVTARTLGHATRDERRRRWRVPVFGGLAVAASILVGVLLVQRDADPEARMAPVAVSDTADAPRSGVPDDSVPPGSPASAERGTRDEPTVSPTLRLAESELSVGGALADLGDDQLEALLRRLEAIDGLPQTSPAPALSTDFEVQ